MCFKTMVFGGGEASPSEAWLPPMQGKVSVRYHSSAGPLGDPGGQEVVALNKLQCIQYND